MHLILSYMVIYGFTNDSVSLSAAVGNSRKGTIMARKVKGQLPSGNVRVRVYDHTDENGKKICKSFTAGSRAEALAMANEWKVSRKYAASNVTILDAVKEYIAVNEPRLSPTTYKTYRGYLRYFEEDPIGRVKLRELTNTDVQKFVNALRQRLSAKSVKNVYNLLKPAVELKRDDFRFKVALPTAERTEKHIPSIEDVKATLDACNAPELRIAILLALQGMMRRGEACALTFDDIDYKCKTITINKAYALTVDNLYVLKETKTSASTRVVSVSDILLDEIKALPRKKGEVLRMRPSQLTDGFVRTVERAGVEHYSFHSLRHLGESLASSMNIPAAYIEAIGGWERGSVVRTRVYDHAISDEQIRYNSAYLNKLDSIFL